MGWSRGHEGRSRAGYFGEVGEAGGLGSGRVVWRWRITGLPGQQWPRGLGSSGRWLNPSSGGEGLLVNLGGQEGVQDEDKRLGVGLEVQFLKEALCYSGTTALLKQMLLKYF